PGARGRVGGRLRRHRDPGGRPRPDLDLAGEARAGDRGGLAAAAPTPGPQRRAGSAAGGPCPAAAGAGGAQLDRPGTANRGRILSDLSDSAPAGGVDLPTVADDQLMIIP